MEKNRRFHQRTRPDGLPPPRLHGTMKKTSWEVFLMQDTIAAVATGPVRAAVGILRLSGPDAIRAAEAVFRA